MKCAINSCEETAITSVPILEYRYKNEQKMLTIPLCKLHLNMYERKNKKK